MKEQNEWLKLERRSEAQIRSCENLGTLRRWGRRAMRATNIDELFETT